MVYAETARQGGGSTSSDVETANVIVLYRPRKLYSSKSRGRGITNTNARGPADKGEARQFSRAVMRYA